MEITKEMKDAFNKRTTEHIGRVQKFGNIIAEKFYPVYGKEFSNNLIAACEQHDASKFSADERAGQALICYHYANNLRPSEDDMVIMNDAWMHHKSVNDHHPEFFEDIHEMPLLALAHMAADWAAMTDELGGSLLEWYDKTVPAKYDFAYEQVKPLYEFISHCNSIIAKKDDSK